MLSTIATEIKDITISADGKEATFVLVTKHSGEIAVSLPALSLHKLQAAALAPAPTASATKDPDGVPVSVPKKWLVAADQKHGLVVVVLDHRMSGQYAFALNTKAVTEFAAAITKQADTILATGNQKPVL